MGHSDPSKSVGKCFAEENPSTLYMKGVQYFFTFDLKVEGLAYMKRLADEWYEQAVYTYAMTRQIYWEDGMALACLNRQFLERCWESCSRTSMGMGYDSY